MMPQSVGRYQIFSKLGEGGFAAVYRAYDPRLDRDVAVKVLHRNHAADERMRARFLREGAALARVRHPHLVRLFDSGESDGMVYLTMEFIPGRSLAALAAERTLDLSTVSTIVAQVAGALDALHDGGLLHRDIKPANIMLHDDGRAILVDLGVAGLADAAGPTTRSMILGTPGFLAPEQVAGSASADIRTDVYQLAATAYTLLAGRPPFQGETARVLYAVAHESPPGLHQLCPDLPIAVCDLIDGALAKDPARRPGRASEFAARLTDALLPSTVLLPRSAPVLPVAIAREAPKPAPPANATQLTHAVTSLPAPTTKHRSGRRLLIAAALGAALILLGGGAAIVGAGRTGGEQAAPPAKPEWQQPDRPASGSPERHVDDRRQAPRTDATGRTQESITTLARPAATDRPNAAGTATPSLTPEATPAPKPSASPAPSPNPTAMATPAPRYSSSPSSLSTPPSKASTPTPGGNGTPKR